MWFMLFAGSDAILLGAETLRGLYPVETISIVGKICAEVFFLLLGQGQCNKCISFSLSSSWNSFLIS